MEELKNDIVDLKAFFRILWKEKFLFLSIIIAVGLITGIYAFTRMEEFTSEGKILPEVQTKEGKLGGLAGLASLAGVDVGGGDGTDAFRPDLYPVILQSTPFFLELFKQNVVTKENKQINFEKFYHEVVEENEEITDKRIKKFPVKEDGFLVLNRLSEERIEDLKDRIKASIDKKSGVISISVTMPDPVVAASLARFSMIYLTNYITHYRTDKDKQNVDFLKEKMDAARGKFYSTQAKKAQYNDQFQLPTIRLQSADIQRERIESEYRMSSVFYDELVKKYEEANINYQQSIPVYQVLTPPSAPTRKSEPRRAIILLIGLAGGTVLALIVILLKKKNYRAVLAL
ncbi:Wzz/FepE/Etk N-terminal domain-containing protein [Emticicia agri]|uniref:Lipopolysaccharide biosynthesis protein n=1 Tax=Emticicia agri TaxID=2492393 RepID=A0A4Q5LTS8_9BACT|nr:Wzz/FepE/Etk N-terminal domain-containing protein [Emticicia agri]RYU92905.1 lipopolysaccharide biosynthesis protein [Emticicia agri]